MSDGFSLDGLPGLLRSLSDRAEEVMGASDRGLYLAGENVLAVSNRQVPHEEGDLERDGAVIQGVGEVAITYGRDAEVAEYAVPVHEDMDAQHDSGRNAKFLENALNSERDRSLEIIAEQQRRAWVGD